MNCATYNLSIYEGRISVRNPVPGKLFLKHLTKNDLLTYTCEIQLKDINLDQLVYSVNITSSVNCKFMVIYSSLFRVCPRLLSPTDYVFVARKSIA